MSDLSKSGQVVTVRWKFQTADDLLAAISPTHGVLTPSSSYRGHGSAAWSLVPSAWRQLPRHRDRVLTLDPESYHGLVFLEARMLLSFVVFADRQGLAIPHGAERAKALLDPYARFEGCPHVEHWPPDGLLACLALAQHYSTPTRLLDWTYNPYVAAYFAAEDALLRPPSDGSFAIWVYAHSAPDHVFRNGPSVIPKTGLELYKPPYHGNENIRAQRGAFMFIRAQSASATEGLDEFEARRRAELRITGGVPFHQLIVPEKEARPLLRQLALLGVSATGLFPGYAGASKAAAVSAYGLPTEAEYHEGLARHNDEFARQDARREAMIAEGRISVDEPD